MINNKLYLKKSSINLFELFGFNIMYTDKFGIWDNNNNEKMITNYIKKNGIYYIISKNDYYHIEFFIKNNNAYNIKIYKKELNNNYKLILKTMDNEKKR